MYLATTRLLRPLLTLLLLPAAAGATPAATAAATETAVVVASRGVEVPGTLTAPAAAGEPLPLVVLAHGHGGTRDEAGSFRRLAEALAARGIASIRIDFPGCGESREPFTHNNLTNMLQDLLAARRHATDLLPIDAQRIAVHGYSMGGRIALLATEQARWAAVSTWAPVADNGPRGMLSFLGGRERWDALRAVAEREGSVPFVTSWGQEQELGRRWFRDIDESRPLVAVSGYPGPVLAICGERDPITEPAVCERLADTVGPGQAEVHVIGEAGHGLGFYTGNEPQASRTLSATVDFLARSLLPAPSSPFAH